MGKSLFYYEDLSHSCKERKAKVYCICTGNGLSQCSYKTIYHREEFETSTSRWTEMRYGGFTKCSTGRNRRDVQQYIIIPNDGENTDYIYDPKPIGNLSISKWPTVSGKTFETVQNYCRNAIVESETGKVCGKVEGFNFTIFLKQCMEDIKVSIALDFL